VIYDETPYTPDPRLPEDLALRGVLFDQAPHCDAEVVHSPGECHHCDGRPDMQLDRLLTRTAFTGQPVPDGGRPCPSDDRRGLAGAHVWGGNRPTGPSTSPTRRDA
jgi:hypothetical protein